MNLHLVGVIDEGSGQELDERFHYSFGSFFSSDFTVGES
jgi:hypothetical protein